MMLRVTLASHEGARADECIGEPKAEPVEIEIPRGPVIGHVKYRVADMTHAHVVGKLNSTIDAQRLGARQVHRRLGIAAERFHTRHAKADSEAGRVVAVQSAVGIARHLAVFFEFRADTIESRRGNNAPYHFAYGGAGNGRWRQAGVGN